MNKGKASHVAAKIRLPVRQGNAAEVRTGRAGRIGKSDAGKINVPGYKKGYAQGYETGYGTGLNRGRLDVGTPFEGVSIVIPSFNQAEPLMRCLDSIEAHMREAREVIVVDGGSGDGTLEQLGNRSGIRLRIDKPGLASRINQGLRMARGRYILLLSSELTVAGGWFDDMLARLNSLERDSIVGPLPDQAEGGTISADRPSGICILMKREVLDRIGYLDEGAVQNEEEAICFRARVLGIDLSAVKVQASPLQDEVQAIAGDKQLKSTDLYPTHIVVRGPVNLYYWIEHGNRYPITEDWPQAAARMTQLDLLQLPKKEAVSADEVMQRLATLSSTPSPFGKVAEGVIVHTASGDYYQSDRGTLRRLIGSQTLSDWQLDRRPAFMMAEEEAAKFARGLPIIAPPGIQAQNL